VKPTTKLDVALQRLADHMQVAVLNEGLTTLLGVRGSTFGVTEQRRTVRYGRALAYLVRVATLGTQHNGYGLSLDTVRNVTLYEGGAPSQGLAGHEELILQALSPSRPAKKRA
jgi:hypothetical protein